MHTTQPTVGVVGAGQLARMLYQAGIGLGLTLRLLAGRHDDSAALVGADVVHGSPTSFDDLDRFAAGCDVLTFDHELVDPRDLLALEAAGHTLRPSAPAKRYAQDKLHQRERLGQLGFPVPPFRSVQTPEDIHEFAEAHGWPLVLKAVRGGYDGRGVWQVDDGRHATAVAREAAGADVSLLVEPLVPIARELAVQVVRGADGAAVVYPVVETVQRGGICHELLVPAAGAVARPAADLGRRIAEAVDVVGILAVELFETTTGELVVNELAARPHNSAHHTIEGCETSQFENHLRAVLGWPLGSTALRAPAVATANILGSGETDPREWLHDALRVPGAHVHLYGKEPRPGRKLGHVTALGEEIGEARSRAQRTAALLAEGA